MTNQPEATLLARAARWYARRGWAVFPLRPRTKEPFAKLGVYHATTDPTQVAAWWRQWPVANIGLHCGAAGVLALDLDQYKETYQGDKLLTPDDEQTITSLTGSGGTHLLYGMPTAAHYGNATGSLPSGIDIRGYGGYIVLPPSVHPNGNRYQWEAGYGPHEIALLPLPDTLRRILDQCRAYQRPAGPPDRYAVAIGQALVESVLAALDVASDPPQVYDQDGRKWILKRCPFNPDGAPHDADKAAYIVVKRDGRVAAGCHHARCRERLHAARVSGWTYLLQGAAHHVTA